MPDFRALLADITRIHGAAHARAAETASRLLNLRNWLIGAAIVAYEQDGEDRAAYGEALLERLAGELAAAGHSGLSSRNLKNFRQVALAYPELPIRQTSTEFGVALPIRQTSAESAPSAALARLVGQPTTALAWRDGPWIERLFASLSFSHLLELSRVDDPLRRAFYELECLKAGWSVRELKRQRDSMLYERVGLSKDKDAVMALATEGRLIDTPATILRDPYILEFLGLERRATYSESDLEQALLDNLQHFLHELGRDFCFVERQMRITVGGRHHHLDLLFFHRGLRCLIAVDLKLGAFEHENAGQMNFYLNYLKDNVARPDESPPVGIVLCADKDAEEVHYATAGLPHAVFVSRYLVALPSEEQLARWLHEERAQIERNRKRRGSANL